MPTISVKFRTRQESERAIARLEFAGFERERIDRIEDAYGRWRVGLYVDERDAARVRALLTDPDAPTSSDVLNSLLIFGAAALAGIAVGYVLPRGLASHAQDASRRTS